MAKSLDVGLEQDLEVVICDADLKTSWYSIKKTFDNTYIYLVQYYLKKYKTEKLCVSKVIDLQEKSASHQQNRWTDAIVFLVQNNCILANRCYQNLKNSIINNIWIKCISDGAAHCGKIVNDIRLLFSHIGLQKRRFFTV